GLGDPVGEGVDLVGGRRSDGVHAPFYHEGFGRPGGPAAGRSTAEMRAEPLEAVCAAWSGADPFSRASGKRHGDGLVSAPSGVSRENRPSRTEIFRRCASFHAALRELVSSAGGPPILGRRTPVIWPPAAGVGRAPGRRPPAAVPSLTARSGHEPTTSTPIA